MAESVLVLKKKAIAAGMSKTDAIKADRSTLENFISKNSKSGSTAPAKKKATGTRTVAKKKTTTAKAPAKQAPVAKKATATRKATPAAKKSTTTGKAKRSPATSDAGRHMIGSLNFSDTEGWNPREGSPVNDIFKALKKCRGDVDKATALLMPNAKEFVSLKKADGTRRTKAEIGKLLRYRVNRTKFEFARRTGQHESSANRVQYGTGDYASASKPKRKAPARKAPAAKAKPNTRKAPARKTTRR
jgi:hypothetical protein